METQEKQKVDLVETYPSGDYHPPEDCVWSDYLDSHILADKSIAVINADGDSDYIVQNEADDFIFVEDEDVMVHVEATWDCYASSNTLHNTDYRVETYCGHIVHDEYANDHHFHWCEYGEGNGYWIDDSDSCWCEDIEGYVLEEDDIGVSTMKHTTMMKMRWAVHQDQSISTTITHQDIWLLTKLVL